MEELTIHTKIPSISKCESTPSLNISYLNSSNIISKKVSPRKSEYFNQRNQLDWVKKRYQKNASPNYMISN